MERERISELKDRATEIFQSKEQRERETKESGNSSEICGIIVNVLIYT